MECKTQEQKENDSLEFSNPGDANKITSQTNEIARIQAIKYILRTLL